MRYFNGQILRICASATLVSIVIACLQSGCIGKSEHSISSSELQSLLQRSLDDTVLDDYWNSELPGSDLLCIVGQISDSIRLFKFGAPIRIIANDIKRCEDIKWLKPLVCTPRSAQLRFSLRIRNGYHLQCSFSYRKLDDRWSVDSNRVIILR